MQIDVLRENGIITDGAYNINILINTRFDGYLSNRWNEPERSSPTIAIQLSNASAQSSAKVPVYA